jgi:hypothetical protein
VPSGRGQAIDDPAAAAAGLLLRLAIAILAIGVPCAAVVSRRPIFVLMPIGAVLIAIASQLNPGGFQNVRRHMGAALRSPLVLVILFLIFWAGLSLVWTAYADLALERFLKTGGTVLLAAIAMACLPDSIKASNSNLLPIGVAAAALAIVVVAFAIPAATQGGDPDGTTLQRATIGLVILMWPALGALALRARIASAGAIAIGVSVTAVLVWMPAALAGLILALLTFSFAYSNPAPAGRFAGALAAAVILAAPAIPLVFDALLHARINPQGMFRPMLIWNEIVRSEGLRLLTGHGFDTSVRAMIAGVLPQRVPRGILFEIWYDLGLVGATGLAALSWLAFVSASKAPPVLAPFLIAALACILTIAVAGFSIAQLWWMTLLGLAAIGFAVVLRGHHRTERLRATVVTQPRPTL